MKRFLFLLLVAMSSLAIWSTMARADSVIVFKSATCGCCTKWVDHMKAAGFDVSAKNVAMGILSRKKTESGIKPKYASCHTARVGGYTIEGHVPASDVRRLLAEKPVDAIGLVVPGMPLGSPGMEVPGHKDAYNVLLIKKDGSTSIWARH